MMFSLFSGFEEIQMCSAGDVGCRERGSLFESVLHTRGYASETASGVNL